MFKRTSNRQSSERFDYEPVPPFPEALKDTRRYERDKDMYDMFSKCEVNLPLLDFLKSVPRSAKFLKELWSIKRKQQTKAKQKIKISE